MRTVNCWAISVLLLTSAGVRAGGAIFKYVERDGTVVYTNVPPRAAAARSARRLPGELRPAPGPTSPASLGTLRAPVVPYDDVITAAALKYRVPVHLVRAVMHAESAFNPTAVSSAGASGLMQLMPETAQDMYVKNIFDERENIEGGTRYLRVLANTFEGDMVKMVAAYNAGPVAVQKFGGQVPPYPETQAYVRKVLSLYFQYKAQADAPELGEHR
jgi:soluble lytic murein transglycosylase-like protein